MIEVEVGVVEANKPGREPTSKPLKVGQNVVLTGLFEDLKFIGSIYVTGFGLWCYCLDATVVGYLDGDEICFKAEQIGGDEFPFLKARISAVEKGLALGKQILPNPDAPAIMLVIEENEQ